MFLLLEKVTNLIHVNYTEPISKDYYFNRTEDGKILMNFTIDVTHSRNSGRGWLPFIKRFTGFDIYIADTSLWPDLDYFNITNIKECKSPTLETYTIQIESNNQLNDLHLDEGENESLKVMIYPFYQITSKSPPFFSKQPIELEIKIYSKQP